RKAMNDDEKPADTGANPVPPAQPVHPQAAQPITERRTFDVQAEKVEEPSRKDS
ncbi:MAG: twin-arginine translocase TatA/TatE family subunit, partial [Pseudomonas sp.]|nr:twin-arginine translocase TatA/TatE family subunit [Pseudomonas sp.]